MFNYLLQSAVKSILSFVVVCVFAANPAKAGDPYEWNKVLNDAKGQTVFWNAWGGSPRINDYIGWVGKEVEQKYKVRLKHVKVQDAANVVSTIVAEKAAGKDTNGKVDLIWINGENFAAMKRENLLMSPGWAQALPNWKYVDIQNKPTTIVDFTIPTDGLESPWGGAKLVFFHDTARGTPTPDSVVELVEWAKINPGRFTYPKPPNFIGSTFLKQVLIELVTDPKILQSPVVDDHFDEVTKPLFELLDQLHPVMWRQARAFPKNHVAIRQLMADKELDIIFAFNPSFASSAIANDELPPTVRSFVFSRGTLGNTHFVAIPYNANAKAGSLVVANFLLSASAQARKQNPKIWGDPTVLAIDKLNSDERMLFEELDLGVATLNPRDLGPTLPEPHPSWMMGIEKEWARRYAVGK